MGIFDAFGSLFSPDVAGPINEGLTTGYNLAQPNLEQALTAIQGGYSSAIPALRNQYQQALPGFTNLMDTAKGGIGQLTSALGFGPQGAAGMRSTFEATPGYQFARDTGIENAMRTNARLSGGGNSGTLLKDITDYSSGLASQFYNQYLSQLQPFLGLGTQAATGAGNIYTGLGSGLANLYAGRGSDVAGAYGNLANLGWGYGTGQGAAASQQAAIDAQYGSSILGGLGKALTTAIPGSSVLGGIGSGISGLVTSDVRLKDDIAPVGQLYDGTNIWRFTYKDDPQRITHVGVMAQEIERDRPDAVVHDSAGWKHVDYHKATSRAAQLARFAEAA